MKGEILLKILDLIQDTAMAQVDFFATVLASGYGASSSRIEYEYQKRRRIINNKEFQARNLKERKRRLTVFISKMKHDGLIKELKNEKFTISSKGIKKLDQLKQGLPGRHYESVSQNNSVIVSFDIPEKLRRKRNWLREVIKNLGFEMVHQSVWVGKVKIPKQFILDLEYLNILEYVEIFEISKTGTLKKLGKF